MSAPTSVSTRQSEDDGPTLALRLACGEWTHFGLTFEPTASAGDAQAVPMVITLYVNGSVLAAFSAQNVGASPCVPLTAGVLTRALSEQVAANRGALHVGSDGSNGPWPGLVAGVALWEGAVAPEEAQRMGSLPPASAPATSPSAPDLALDGDFVDPAAGSGGVQGQASSDDHAGEVCTSPQACHALAALAGMLGVQPPVAAGEEAGQQLAFATAVRAFLSCGPRLDSLAPGVQSVLAGASAVAARHISSSPSAHTAAQSLLAEGAPSLSSPFARPHACEALRACTSHPAQRTRCCAAATTGVKGWRRRFCRRLPQPHCSGTGRPASSSGPCCCEECSAKPQANRHWRRRRRRRRRGQRVKRRRVARLLSKGRKRRSWLIQVMQ